MRRRQLLRPQVAAAGEESSCGRVQVCIRALHRAPLKEGEGLLSFARHPPEPSIPEQGHAASFSFPCFPLLMKVCFVL